MRHACHMHAPACMPLAGHQCSGLLESTGVCWSHPKLRPPRALQPAPCRAEARTTVATATVTGLATQRPHPRHVHSGAVLHRMLRPQVPVVISAVVAFDLAGTAAWDVELVRGAGRAACVHCAGQQQNMCWLGAPGCERAPKRVGPANCAGTYTAGSATNMATVVTFVNITSGKTGKALPCLHNRVSHTDTMPCDTLALLVAVLPGTPTTRSCIHQLPREGRRAAAAICRRPAPPAGGEGRQQLLHLRQPGVPRVRPGRGQITTLEEVHQRLMWLCQRRC
jgi:hypothetical protein